MTSASIGHVDLILRVEEALASVRMAMGADGGGVRLQRLDGDVVFLELLGACKICPSQTLTIGQTLQPLLRRALPAGVRVEFVTD